MNGFISSDTVHSTQYTVHSTQYTAYCTKYSNFLLNLRKIGVRMALLPVIVFVLFLTVNNVKADDPPPPCEMDCLPQSPWTHGLSTWFDVDPINCPGCQMRFEFWWRSDACGVYKDIQLGQINLTLACVTCSKTIKEYVDIAIDSLILNNPIPKPDTNTCDTLWRAIFASCWKFYASFDTVLVPCEPSQCCWRKVSVCTDSLGNLTYSQEPRFATPDLCFIHQGPCTFVCDEMPEPSPMPSGLEENINEQNGFSTLVYPNPGTDWFNIKFRSESEGQHTIEVFDATGNLITIKDFGKVQDEIIIQLNMSSLSSGNYRYVIK